MTVIVAISNNTREPLSFKTRRSALWLSFLIPIVLVGISIVTASTRPEKSEKLAYNTEKLPNSDSDLDTIRDVAAQFAQKGIPLRKSLDSIFPELLSNKIASPGQLLMRNSGLWKNEFGTTRPLAEIAGLTQAGLSLEIVQGEIRMPGNLIVSRQEVLAKIPSLWPISIGKGRITTNFGTETNPFTGKAYVHTGLDITNGRIGDPVIATADGTIISAGFDSTYGNNVVIRHSYGYTTRYGHMKTLTVRKGQKVARRDIIGLVGNTGLTTGPHVHYEVFLSGKLVNPLDYIDLAAALFER
ncbi:MAG: hypothetical protein CVV53_05235 [Spirochaetae bacterium HGW-Spirochaetae-9]|nr:MAG: hypothetical protein CVV53_05235 [Spirochaetae bacterium HGW-Spirochaetae-9]